MFSVKFSSKYSYYFNRNKYFLINNECATIEKDISHMEYFVRVVKWR